MINTLAKKTSVQAPANIAFIKYWGKENEFLRLPNNDSLSMNISGAYTTTTVEFLPGLQKDDISYKDETISEQEQLRISEHLDRLRAIGKTRMYAKVVTKNSFPKGTGIASSASGFAALTLAASSALSLSLSEKELTILARLGSGSACRSIPDGFVLWHRGNSSETSYAESVYPSSYWKLYDILVIVTHERKKISSTEGMKNAYTSRFWKQRLTNVPKRIAMIKQALQKKDMVLLGTCIEEDCLEMHKVMQTQNPPLLYWNKITNRIMDAVCAWRKEGIRAYFTIDAGPNVHLICQEDQKDKVMDKLNKIKDVDSIVVNTVAPGAQRVQTHLF